MKSPGYYILPVLLFIFISACRHSGEKDHSVEPVFSPEEQIKRDAIPFYIDSFQLSSFFQHYPQNNIQKGNLEAFYNKRNNEFAWINSFGINEYARNFVNLLNHEEILGQSDSAPSRNQLFELYNSFPQESFSCRYNDSHIADLELLLTAFFFDYAKRNWRGINDEQLKAVNWFVVRKKINYENLLDTVLKNKAYNLSSFDPVYRQYGFLKKQLQKYVDIENKGGWEDWSFRGNKLQKGDTSLAIPFIKEQLYMLEDLALKDSSNLFEIALEEAVKKFQKRHGLKEDGLIEGKTLQALRVPLSERIKQILINMERNRWLPVDQQGDYLVVNIPAFKLLVYQKDSLAWSCNVIVGKSTPASNTVIFSDYLEYIVFSPYWNVPKNILIKETLPEIKNDPNYLLKHDMEIVDAKGIPIEASSVDWNMYTDNFPYIIRQNPGENNALGLVKFLFPNSYDIYMHDTPEKSLFGETVRAFSHGCIRLEEPVKLARFLLRNDTSWADEKINSFMYGGKEVFVRLKNKIPVFITYFTAWVDRSGKLNFREDVYHHDAKMEEILFTD